MKKVLRQQETTTLDDVLEIRLSNRDGLTFVQRMGKMRQLMTMLMTITTVSTALIGVSSLSLNGFFQNKVGTHNSATTGYRIPTNHFLSSSSRQWEKILRPSHHRQRDFALSANKPATTRRRHFSSSLAPSFHVSHDIPAPLGSSLSLSVRRQSRLFGQPAGSFFNPVPNSDDDDETDNEEIDKQNSNEDSGGMSNANNSTTAEVEQDNTTSSSPLAASSDPFDSKMLKLLRDRKSPSLASQPSTLNGKPTAGQGFGKSNKKQTGSKPYVAIGPQSVNDPRKPEYDDQGYILYANETTGEKARVFEALVEYPCDFTLKIVGANEGNFIQEMIAVVAESCDVSVQNVPYTYRALGKWLSVTVQAPVKSAEMLYELYENVDKDPRVKFKF